MKRTYYEGKELFVAQGGGTFSNKVKKNGLFISEKELEICDPYVNPDCRITWFISFEPLSVDYIKGLSAHMDDLEYEDFLIQG